MRTAILTAWLHRGSVWKDGIGGIRLMPTGLYCSLPSSGCFCYAVQDTSNCFAEDGLQCTTVSRGPTSDHRHSRLSRSYLQQGTAANKSSTERRKPLPLKPGSHGFAQRLKQLRLGLVLGRAICGLGSPSGELQGVLQDQGQQPWTNGEGIAK